MAQQDTYSATDQAEHDSLHEELPKDVSSPSPDGHPKSNLTCPFGDRNEHDVHDPHAANHQ